MAVSAVSVTGELGSSWRQQMSTRDETREQLSASHSSVLSAYGNI